MPNPQRHCQGKPTNSQEKYQQSFAFDLADDVSGDAPIALGFQSRACVQ